MATIRDSVEVRLPAQALYERLTRFEDYAQFMDRVDAVQRLDDAHLRWTTSMANRPVEWNSTVATHEADRRITWHAVDGVCNSGTLAVLPVSDDVSTVELSLDIVSGQFPGAMAGDSDAETAQHLKRSLDRLKDYAENGGTGSGPSCGMLHPGNVASPASTSGSPTEVLEDEPNESGPFRA